MTNENRAWFAPKRYGLGAGMPIAWQGWALLVGYVAVVLAATRLLPHHGIAGLAIVVAATVVLVVVSAQRTRGGWRWRWGE